MNNRSSLFSEIRLPGVFAVVATYGYFLLFAEFAFLELVRTGLRLESDLRPVMGAMGVGGIVGSFAAAWRFGPATFLNRLSGSYVACAAAAGVALLAVDESTFIVAAALIGVTLGWNTVTLAAGLRGLLTEKWLGLGAGLGTGSAYAFCNVPVVFTASPRVQTWICLIGAIVAAVVVRRTKPKFAVTASRPSDATGVGCWIVIFLALVSLDSAVFYVIQHTAGYRDVTWTGTARLWTNASIHLLAAMAASWLLGRGLLRAIAVLAWFLLAISCVAFERTVFVPAISLLYAGGVSLYSAALVYFAARESRPLIASTVFAVAGWAGSALGIGLAQDMHGIPRWLVAVTGAVLLFGMMGKSGRRVVAGLGILFFVSRQKAAASDLTGLEEEGRQVYIGEGCIYCHSQYVRPRLRTEVERWGPAHSLEDLRREQPPLPGNRRQGPDLSNVANRRSAEWNRLHLFSPREVSPGSRMPSYAYLFKPGDRRGPALLAYLTALGSGTREDRQDLTRQWKPTEAEHILSTEQSARLYRKNCAQCHGPEGRGDGTLVVKLSERPPDWRKDDWRLAVGGDNEQLARVIKFGVPDSAMAGHESLSDSEIIGLVHYLKSLHR